MKELPLEDLNSIQGNWDKFKNSFLEYAPAYIISTISAILILIIGLWLIKLINRFIQKIFEKKDFGISLRNFLGKLINIVLKVLLFIIVASQIGIPTTSFIALIGAAGLAIGLSLQGSLSNFAGGVLILTFKPFKVGDYIASSNGVAGTVTLIDIFNTKLKTPQNQLVVVPNGELSNSSITNYSAFTDRRTWIDVQVPYSADLKKVKEVLLQVAKSNEFAYQDPAPQIVVTGLGESAVNLSVRVTTSNADFWAMNEQLIIDCKYALEEAGVSAPYPKRSVHVFDRTSEEEARSQK